MTNSAIERLRAIVRNLSLVKLPHLGGLPVFAKTFVTLILILPTLAAADDQTDYRVLATSKTSTMQKEMQEAGSAGYRFVAVMGGDTAFGGSEVVVLMQ